MNKVDLIRGKTYLVESLHLLLGPDLAVCPQQPRRVPVGHVALVTLLALEVDLALVALEQAHVVDLPNIQCYHTRSTVTAAGHLVLVPVPVGPAGGQLAAQLARAAPVLVDEVVQGHVGARRRLLPVSDDQGSVNICSVRLSSLSTNR